MPYGRLPRRTTAAYRIVIDAADADATRRTGKIWLGPVVVFTDDDLTLGGAEAEAELLTRFAEAQTAAFHAAPTVRSAPAVTEADLADANRGDLVSVGLLGAPTWMYANPNPLIVPEAEGRPWLLVTGNAATLRRRGGPWFATGELPVGVRFVDRTVPVNDPTIQRAR